MEYEALFRKISNRELTPGREDEIDKAIASLPKVSRDILYYRYRDGMSFQAIGDIYGVSRQRAEQREREALRLLTARMFIAKDIDALGLEFGAYNALVRANVTSLAELDELAKQGKLTTIKGIGAGKAANIMMCLIEYKERMGTHGNTL